MTIKITARLGANVPPCGWSETYYIPGTTLTNVGSWAAAFLAERIKVAPSAVRVISVMGSVPGSPRRYYSVSFTEDNTGTYNSEAAMTEPWSALLLTKSNNFKAFSNSYLHGIPQSQVVNGVYTPAGTFDADLEDFKAWVSANGGMYAKDPDDPGSGKQFMVITDFQTVRLVEHKIGRPFGLLRGRQLAG